MDNLKKRIIYEYTIICTCITIFTLYIMGLIILNIYNFLLATIQAILAGVIMMFILPLYFHDLKIADEKSEIKKNTKTTINTTKTFWSYCITVSLIIFITSTTIFMILWILVLSNIAYILISFTLNKIATILIIVMTISLIVGAIICIVRETYKKEITNN